MKKDKQDQRPCEVRQVKHEYTVPEKVQLGSELAHAHEKLGNIEKEFEEVRTGFKARIAAQEAQVGVLATNLRNGYDFRAERVWVTMRPKDKKKDWRLEGDDETAAPVLTEDMTPDDFQYQFQMDERKFEAKEEIVLFPSVGDAYGNLIVGRSKDRWFSALRMRVAGMDLVESLNLEGKNWKNRRDCVRQSVARASAWIADKHGLEVANGFAAGFDDVIAAHKEREE